MQHHIKSAEDLAWLLTHTQWFRGGYVTDVHVSKRRLLDEASGREVLVGTSVTTVIRYQLRGVTRVARLTMTGVTDFSIFEQEGADCSTLGVIHAEALAGRLRFWFDPQGELYVVCEEADLEEVSTPLLDARPVSHVPQWTVQGQSAEGPTVEWLLAELDQAGVPCAWRAVKHARLSHPTVQWEGDLIPAADCDTVHAKCVHVMLYGPLDGPGFGVMLRVMGTQDRQSCRVLALIADVIAQRFMGNCLVGNTIIPGGEWLSWKSLKQGRWADA